MDPIFFVYAIIVLLFSVVIHEVAHGYAAEKLGDPTARMAGRLTLNPIKHLDPFGSFLVPLMFYLFGAPFILGWAKPVPYNPNLLYKDYKYGPLKVALAGPASNIVLALVFGLVLRFAHPFFAPAAVYLMGFVVFLNVLLAVFNMVPIPPLDGSKILTVLLPRQYAFMFEQIGLFGIIFVLIFLFLFIGVVFNVAMFLSELIAGPEAWRVFLTTLRG